MIRKTLKKVLYAPETKNGYFANDHHYYNGQEGKDAEWDNLLKSMTKDFYDEYISLFIKDEDKDLWEVADSFMLYMLCKEIVKGK